MGGLFCGQPPREVHIRVEALSGLPASELLADRCQARFTAKEMRLVSFYGPLEDGTSSRPDVAAFAADCESMALLSAPGVRSLMLMGLASLVVLETGSIIMLVRFPWFSLIYSAL